MKKRHIQKLTLISLILALAFNLPLLLIFNSEAAIFGIPKILFYVFTLWAASAIVSLIIFQKYND
ncbi:MAG: hypothetical protein U0X58_01555 [Flavobacteriaceae bacterium]|nr:hypothetical protein [Bacteroidota bacterium]